MVKKTSATKTSETQESPVVKSEKKSSSRSSVKAPQTMEELLSMTGYALKGVKKGDVVDGVITHVNPKEITIDIGSKTEGVIIDRELENYREMLMALKPGDKVVCQVIVAENDRGQSVLSLRRSIFEKRWVDLAEHQKNG